VTPGGVDREWIEHVAGPIVTLEPMAGGGSRQMSILDVDADGTTRELVVRSDSGGGPFTGTRFGSLANEAAVYRALGGSGLPIPELIALSGDERHLVATRLRGSNDFRGIADPEVQASVRRSYLEQLAALHALDPALMDLDRIQPTGQPVTATSWLARWEELASSRIRRPVPVLRLAVRWLEENAPSEFDGPVICHGDVGPGNFLHADGKVTGLLDWELCHLGDRHDDIGMLTLRGHQLNGFGDVLEDLAYYEEVSGQPLDRDRVRYYRAVALILGLVTSVMQLDSTETERVQIPLYLHLVPTLELMLIQAVAEAAGVELDEPEPAADAGDVVDYEAADVASALGERLQAQAEDSLLSAGPKDLVAHLDARARLGAAIDEADLSGVEQVLGWRPPSYPAARAVLDDAAKAGDLDAGAFLRWAFQSGRRRAALWPAWAPVMGIPLLNVG
jgi:aminoglycoside phosphotransferase (APT) family kinase protein